MEKAVDFAQSFLGLRNLKPFQRSALIGILQGRDIFVSQPTGSGKSAIYQLAPVVFDSYDTLLFCGTEQLSAIVASVLQTEEFVSTVSDRAEAHFLVIQPLISLIEDQINKFSGGKIKVSRL
eukprot:gene12490-13773_t